MEHLTDLKTDRLGGVDVHPADLEAMQSGDYILHACAGDLSHHPANKIRLPIDPEGHVQRLGLVLSPEGAIYATQRTWFHKSTDGGATWNHLQRDPGAFNGWMLQFDSEGKMLNVSHAGDRSAPTVWSSEDEGESWDQIGPVAVDASEVLSLGFSVTRVIDGTLLLPVLVGSNRIGDGEAALVEPATCRIYRSEDGGRTWPTYSVLGDWCCEVNLHQLPAGRLLAAIRCQRHSLPGDPPDLLERTGAAAIDQPFPFKHAFVAHSDDRGQSWSQPRQLATLPGQCYCAGVGLSNDRAVVIMDHRYPRKMGSGRAMVSHDGGETWEDEVYYISHGWAAGYAATISLDDEEMLTLTGSCYGDVSSWNNCVGNTEFSIIRWRLA